MRGVVSLALQDFNTTSGAGGIGGFGGSQVKKKNNNTNTNTGGTGGYSSGGSNGGVGSGKLNAIKGMLKKSSESYFDGQKAMLGASRDTQINQLKKAYDEAVRQGNLSITDANRQFEEQVEQINQNAYKDSQVTQLVSNRMGIQNSQQMVGLMAGDNARKNSLTRDSMSDRDYRVNQLKDRINSLGLKKDLDIQTANTMYDAGIQQARSQADMMYTDKWANIQHEDYTARRNYGFEMSKIATQHRNAVARMNQQANAQAQQIKDQYKIAMERKAKSLGLSPGSSEYAIAQAEMSQAMERDLQQVHIKAQYSALSEVIGSDPSHPAYSIWASNPMLVLQNPDKYLGVSTNTVEATNASRNPNPIGDYHLNDSYTIHSPTTDKGLWGNMMNGMKTGWNVVWGQ
jgi:hypothetical protein